jgi:Ca2+-binding RTX toxin-like protein
MFLESLEGRRLLTVTVVQGYPGFYEIFGDDSDNEITIDVNPTDQTFSIDGLAFGGAQQVAVYGRGGNDLIMVSSSLPGFAVSASIDGGDGDDIISLNFDGAVTGGPGNDRIYLYDSFRGEAYGGAGDDYIWIAGNSVDANIDGGEGDDWIDASSNYYKVFIHGGGGNDVIFGSNFDDHLFGDGGNDAIYGLGGNDTIFIRDGNYDVADGGGDIGDICFCDFQIGMQDSVSGFKTVFYG